MAQDLAQMVLDFQKNLKPAQFHMLNNLSFNNFSTKSSPEGVLALGLLLPVLGPGHGPDGPGGPKNLKLTHFYMLNIFCLNNFPKKSSPGGVLALGLLLAVYGPGLGPDGPGGSEKP